ncbi:WbqC family protein [Achromobacter xylosoxidans]
MRIAIHQPNYVPWSGYFYKIAQCDQFVFLDDAQYTKNSFINRNRIKTPQGEHWLTIPVSVSLGQAIREIQLQRGAADKHIKTLQQSYAKTPGYKLYMDGFADLLRAEHANLAELNIALIGHICLLLGINTPTVRASELEIAGSSDERLAAITAHLGGDTYLSGFGGANYQLEQTFSSKKITLETYKFRPPVYRQPWGEFIPGLSILDVLFNCGEQAMAVITEASAAT